MRKLFFWIHLILGTAAAAVILIMSVTGVLLMYERQMIEWADRGYRSTPGPERMAPEALLRAVADQTGKMPESLTVRAANDAPAELTVGPRVIFADAYTGKILGEGATGIRRFFRSVTDWHRWLALEGTSRQTGRAITGAANLVFLFLALSGMYLWLPRKWTRSNVRAVGLFRGGLSGKARDFNWHNVIGIWSAIPLVLVIVGAVVISYPWATGLVYRAAGEQPPAAQGRPAGPGGPGGGGPRGEGGRGGGGRGPSLNGLDAAWKQAEAAVPGWQSITWRAGGGPRIALAISESQNRGRVDLRSTLQVERASGEIAAHEKFSEFSRGRQWRSWLRFIHTGEALGVVGQTIAGLVSLGGAVLVWTGIALTWRRFRAWRARRPVQLANAAD